MGGFQAVAAGLGETGEQAGQGITNAVNEALKVRSQLFGEQQQSGELALRQLQTKQQYDIAQQVHELTRQQIIQSGWKDMGVTMDPQSNQYYRSFYNDATKETSRVPVQGIPPDSPAGLMNYYKNLKGMTDEYGKAMFSDLQAKQIAFKMPQLYREGPVGMMQGFNDYAQELEASGVKKIKSSTGKMLDISTPEGQQAFAQDQLDLIYGRSGFFRYGAGSFATAGGRDMTGWTPGEMREFNAIENTAKANESLLERLAVARMNVTLDPTVQDAIQKQLLEQLSKLSGPVEEKYAEISNRHHGAIAFTVPPGAPDPTKQKDGTLLQDSNGNIIAKIKGGKYVPPNAP